MINPDFSAFPIPENQYGAGIDIRTYIATRTFQVTLCRYPATKEFAEMAEDAVAAADALIEALNKPVKG